MGSKAPPYVGHLPAENSRNQPNAKSMCAVLTCGDVARAGLNHDNERDLEQKRSGRNVGPAGKVLPTTCAPTASFLPGTGNLDGLYLETEQRTRGDRTSRGSPSSSLFQASAADENRYPQVQPARSIAFRETTTSYKKVPCAQRSLERRSHVF